MADSEERQGISEGDFVKRLRELSDELIELAEHERKLYPLDPMARPEDVERASTIQLLSVRVNDLDMACQGVVLVYARTKDQQPLPETS